MCGFLEGEVGATLFYVFNICFFHRAVMTTKIEDIERLA